MGVADERGVPGGRAGARSVGRADELARVLLALGDLTGGQVGVERDVSWGDEPVVWLGTANRARWTSLLDPSGSSDDEVVPVAATERATRLAALDAVHGDERLVRAGWLWVVGQTPSGRPLRFPLISAPVRLGASGAHRLGSVLGSAVGAELRLDPRQERVTRAGSAPGSRAASDGLVARRGGDVTVSASDTELAAALAARVDPRWGHEPRSVDRAEGASHPALRKWLRDALAAAGTPGAVLVAPVPPGPDGTGPSVGDLVAGEAVVVPGVALYVQREATVTEFGAALRRWSAVPGIERTAQALLVTAPDADLSPDHEAPEAPPLRSPLVLTVAQADAVHQSRHAPLTVVAGPPGTGKTHLVAAVALDVVARGGSVLVATRSGPATAAVARALERQPGPPPVRFGDVEDRRRTADALSAMVSARPGPDALMAARRDDDAAEARRHHLESALLAALAEEALAGSVDEWAGRLPDLERTVPGSASTDLDLPELAAELERARRGGDGWWERWRARRAEGRLRDALGAGDGVPLAVLADAVTAAAARRADATLMAIGGTRLDAAWRALLAADEAARAARGQRLTLEATERAGAERANRFAVESLATALRAGRARRRTFLATVDGTRVIDALPLWLGTLGDIEDLLPAQPGLFDLVILDEASQIDLPSAAPALLRARRALVVGDRHQLRHVSFVSDDAVSASLATHGLEHLRTSLDVRRVSLFDAAAARAPTITLDEHFRSVPHLIDWGARRVYGGRVSVTTRRPATDDLDAIEVVAVGGVRRQGGHNPAEVAAAREVLIDLLDDDVTSIGLVSPFRAQADALERMVLAEVPLGRLEQLDLLVGTVHGFQGAERDVVVASLTLDGGGGRAQRFVDDPNLFNVLVTRARRRFVLLHSLTAPVRGVLADYLTQADRPPGSVHEALDDPWVRAVADALGDAGVAVHTGYPVGQHVLDIVLARHDPPVAIDVRVHPGGPAAHLARRRTLAALGWRFLDAHPTAHADDPLAAALAVKDQL